MEDKISKEVLLDIDPIPDYIEGKSLTSSQFVIAIGKNGLYSFGNDDFNLFGPLNLHSLIELYRYLKPGKYDFKIGYLKTEETFLVKHPISGKITEWTYDSALEFCCNNSSYKFEEFEKLFSKDPKSAYRYAKELNQKIIFSGRRNKNTKQIQSDV